MALQADTKDLGPGLELYQLPSMLWIISRATFRMDVGLYVREI